MKMLDCVEIIVEKDKYVKRGVHRGMQGVIWEPECNNGEWVVLIPRYGEKADIADLYIKEEDLRLLPDGMDARINEEIEARFEHSGENAKAFADGDLSDYMV